MRFSRKIAWGGIGAPAIGLAFLYVLMGGQTASAASPYTAAIATDGDVAVSVASSLATGTGKGIGVDNVVVQTTCPTGYTLTITGAEDNNLYLNGDKTDSNNKLVPSAGTFAKPVALSGSSWGYSLSSSTADGTFAGLTKSEQAVKTGNSATPTNGTKIPVYYGASIEMSKVAGTYYAPNATVMYSLTMDTNCETMHEITLDSQDATTEGSTKIYERYGDGWYSEDAGVNKITKITVPTKTSYAFKGYYTEIDGKGEQRIDENGNITAANTTYVSNATLYAYWVLTKQ